MWTNKETWNVHVGLNGLAQFETKLASYHNTPFTNVCLGMTVNDVTNWIRLNYPATSLYSVLADGHYHETNAGKAEWMSLIHGSSIQKYCHKEGFNVQCSYSSLQSRIGIFSNNQNNCGSCNSVIGFGFQADKELEMVKWEHLSYSFRKYNVKDIWVYFRSVNKQHCNLKDLKFLHKNDLYVYASYMLYILPHEECL